MNGENIPSKIHIESELAPLKKVLIHTPGIEVECMSPEDIGRYLFHGVLFLKDILKGYSVFKNVLSKVAKVYEIRECLADVFENLQLREECLNYVLHFYGRMELKSELLSFDSNTLARILIEGLERKKSGLKNSLSSLVSDSHYLLQPLPNMFFTRDTSVVVGNKFISPRMAHAVRFIETILTRTIFLHHPDLRGDGLLLDGSKNEGPFFNLEGGDVHVWNKDLYIIGVSARTNIAAVDAFVDAFIKDRKEKKDDSPFHVLAMFLPKTPSMIHLDMLFTRVSERQALAYAPGVQGVRSFRTVKISVNHEGVKHLEDMGSLLTALKSVGCPIEPIFCGGNQSLIQQQREQWVSGTNSFAFAPGKVICYENQYTLRSLEDAGFKIITGTDFVKNFDAYKSQENIVVTIDGSQLAQGGGGPRCMTCPILRQ